MSWPTIYIYRACISVLHIHEIVQTNEVDVACMYTVFHCIILVLSVVLEKAGQLNLIDPSDDLKEVWP